MFLNLIDFNSEPAVLSANSTSISDGVNSPPVIVLPKIAWSSVNFVDCPSIIKYIFPETLTSVLSIVKLSVPLCPHSQDLKYVVVWSLYKDKVLLSRHKERDTEEDYDKCSCCCFYYPSEFEILPED